MTIYIIEDMDVSKSVLQMTKDGKEINRFHSILDASKALGIDSSGISKVCKGKRKTTGGFVWKYCETISRNHPEGGKEIPGFSNYLAFPDGRVYSKLSGEFMKVSDRTGYNTVSLIDDDKKRKKRSVHRLVILTFGKEVEGKRIVNHKDGEKTNNSTENLEWTTQGENIKHAHDSGLISCRTRRVIKYDSKTGKKINEYNSITEAAKDSDVSYGTIRRHISGKIKQGRKGVFFRPVETNFHLRRADIEGEIWKLISTHPTYEVSSYGRIYSSKSDIILRTYTHKSGYVQVKIGTKKTPKNYKIHQLVAYAFLGPPPQDGRRYIAHHKDANPSNNHAENLEWVTYSKNALERYKTGNRKMKKVKEVSEDGETIKIYENAVEAAKELGVQYQTVYKACTGATKKCKGKILAYVD